MKFEIIYTDLAKKQFKELANDNSKKAQFQAVGKTLARMEQDLHHPSLRTHEYSKLSISLGYKVFESYAQNKTPGAFRVFGRYGPDKSKITIIAITPHP